MRTCTLKNQTDIQASVLHELEKNAGIEPKKKPRINKKMGDGLDNVMTGLGTEMDKSTHNRWTHSGSNYDHVMLSARYREDWLSQKIVDIIAEDCTREWRHFHEDTVAQEADEYFNVQSLFCDAQRWARLYGTAYIVLDIKGSGPINTPLKLDKLKKGCVSSMQVVDRTRLVPMGTIDTTPMSPNYGMPDFYQFVGNASPIHASRIIRFEGTKLPLYEMMRNNYVSDSILIPLFTTIDNFHMAAGAAASACVEINSDVVSIEGLQELLSNPEGERALLKRFRMMKQMKSAHNIILMDAREEFQGKNISLTGLQNLIWEYLQIVSAAVGIPATRFLATQPKGLNASGDADISNYVDTLKGYQKVDLRPKLSIIDKIIQAHFGLGDWKYEWCDLFPESAAQAQERKKALCDAIAKLVETGTITPEAGIAVLEQAEVFGTLKLGKAPAFLPTSKPTPQGKANGS